MSDHTQDFADYQHLYPLLDRIPSLGEKELEEVYLSVLGRSQGELTFQLREKLAKLPQVEKKLLGKSANELKAKFEAAIAERRAALSLERAGQARAGLDLTLPGRRRWIGAEHPVTRVTEEIVEIFRGLGFARAEGPEAETEWFNFGALNFPPDHPAMDMQDTLYLDTGERRRDGDRRRGRTSGVAQGSERRAAETDRRGREEGRVLLRTHTSPVQIRTLLEAKPPIRVVIPGMVYRKDIFDPSHAPAFMQVEGLVVDEGVSFVDLKATLLHFARTFFSPETRVRFRPSYFPFTEPSAEMDVSHLLCGGKGCPVCKGTGWMEILGCGMVHPAVLENCGVDSERYTGFAFGMGPHRIAMQRYNIPDIRLLFESDMAFLSQFVEGHAAGQNGGGKA
jgi:phenylalanyl-tRNA synthetase alpha chain